MKNKKPSEFLIFQDAELFKAIKAKVERNLSPQKALSIARGAKEVMVKLTGSTKNATHMKKHLDYTSRNGEVELEDQNGNKFKGKADIKYLALDWRDQQIGKYGRMTTTLVFSMPAGTDREKVKEATRRVAKKEFKDYNYVMAEHKDTKSPHVHLCVNTLSPVTDKKLRLNFANTQRIRQEFAKELKDLGVDAVATPRAIRGKIRRNERLEVKKARERLGTLLVDEKKVEQALLEIKGKKEKNEFWKLRKESEQKIIRNSWEEIKTGFENAGKILEAREIEKYIDRMPKVETKHEALQNFIIAEQQKNKNLDIER